MKRICLWTGSGWCLWCLLGAVAGAQSNDPAEVLQGKYQAALLELTQRHQQSQAQGSADYTNGLQAMEQELKKKGDLDGVLAVRKERDRLVFDNAIPDGKEEGAEAIHQDIADLREKYWQKMAKARIEKERGVVTLVQQYTNRLAAIEKQLTQTGDIEKALATRAEIKRVSEGEEYRTALAGVIAATPEPKSKARATDRPSTPEPDSTVSALDAALDRVRVSSFRVSEWELTRIDLINRLIQEVFTRGIRIRVDAPSLNIQSVSYDNNIPRYYANYRGNEASRDRPRNCQLTDATARTVLHLVCAGLKVGYRLDAAKGEVIIVNGDAPDAEWSGSTLDDVREALRTSAGPKRKTTGRTIVVTAEISSMMQGMKDWTILSNRDKIRLFFPKANLTEAQFNEMKTRLAESDKRNREARSDRQYTDITVLGDVGSGSGASMVVLENCRFLGSSSGWRYDEPDVSTGTKKIKRLGE